MTSTEIIVILIIALLLSLVLVGVLGWRRAPGEPAWPAAVFIFLILFLTIWLAQLWLRPIGPSFAGVHWVPALIVGLVIVLIATALIPPRPRRPVIEIGAPAPETSVAFAFGLFFWLLLVILIVSIIVSYTVA